MSGEENLEKKLFGQELKKPKKSKKSKKSLNGDEGDVYVYKGQVHHPGDKDPCEICLTEDDLDPNKDPILTHLLGFMDKEEAKNYIKMPVLRDLQTFLRANETRLREEFIRYKKRGRIKPLAEINKKG